MPGEQVVEALIDGDDLVDRVASAQVAQAVAAIPRLAERLGPGALPVEIAIVATVQQCAPPEKVSTNPSTRPSPDTSASFAVGRAPQLSAAAPASERRITLPPPRSVMTMLR